ncbi:MAG: hypothetical protein JW836_15560 [Deltaproteobacteria bacterium]|nr:hypothetical protein [Deltaproteobacteria bacterium]
MARLLHCHPGRTIYFFHVFTDLDFWDARRIFKDLAAVKVKRNFSKDPPGDEFPTQVVTDDRARATRADIEKRLKRALASPPRHVIVDGLLKDGFFEFNPLDYFPKHWSREKMFRFALNRLPLENAVLNSPYRTVHITWHDEKIRVERAKRKEKYDPVIRTKEEALKRVMIPGCF